MFLKTLMSSSLPYTTLDIRKNIELRVLLSFLTWNAYLRNTNATKKGPLNTGTGSGSSAVNNTNGSKQGLWRAGTVLGRTGVDNTNAPKQGQRAAKSNATKLRPRK